jgi:hypothetical protein
LGDGVKHCSFVGDWCGVVVLSPLRGVKHEISTVMRIKMSAMT